MNSQRRNNRIIEWKEVPPANGGLISAAASVSQGFSQFYTDILVANEAFENHYKKCKCNEDENYCLEAKSIGLEIARRLTEFVPFFKTMDSVERMFAWTGFIVDEGDGVTVD